MGWMGASRVKLTKPREGREEQRAAKRRADRDARVEKSTYNGEERSEEQDPKYVLAAAALRFSRGCRFARRTLHTLTFHSLSV